MRLKLPASKSTKEVLNLKDVVMSSSYKTRSNRIELALSMEGRGSISDAYNLVKPQGSHWYRESIYISDLTYILARLGDYLHFEQEYILGVDIAIAKARVDGFLNNVATLSKSDKPKAKKLLLDALSIKNPLLYLLQYCNEHKIKFFESGLAELFENKEYQHTKALSLLKRNLAISKPSLREKVQKQYSIDTGDLKISDSGYVTYYCAACSTRNVFNVDSYRKEPIQACKKCSAKISPCRHLNGYKTNEGLIVSIKRTEAKVMTDKSIITVPTDELIEKEIKFLTSKGDKTLLQSFTSLMLWHHKGYMGDCSCVSCSS